MMMVVVWVTKHGGLANLQSSDLKGLSKCEDSETDDEGTG